MSGLSDLSRTYMEFIEDIRAGERALADDVGRLLAQLAQPRSDGTNSTPTALERRWEPTDGAIFTLRLAWDPREGWPALTLESKTETGLFDPACLRACVLSQPDRIAIFSDPAAEVLRAWDEGCAQVEAWIGSGEVRTRIGALAILKEVSRRGRSALKPMPAGFTQNEGKVSGYVANANYPAYVEWYDQDAKTGKRISWEVLYHHEDRPNRPAGLHLVCFNGAHVPHLLQDHPAVGSYVSHPILLAWPERLAAVVAEQVTPTEASISVLADVNRVYAAYRQRLDGQAQ